MSAAALQPPAGRPLARFARQGSVLVLLMLLVLGARRLVPGDGHLAAPILGLGVLLLMGDVAAELVDWIGLPHLTGYLLAGLVMGPQCLGAVSEATVGQLGLVNTLALALIALSAGAELTLRLLSKGLRGLVASIGAQLALGLPAGILAVLILRPWLPFLAALPLRAATGVALLWAVMALSRSPSATLGVISQLRPEGPLTRHTLAVVVSFDVVVLIAFTLARSVCQVLVEPTQTFSMATLHELSTGMFGSFACGISLGLGVAAYLRWVGKQELPFLVLVAYGATEFTSYFHFEPLLLFLTAGFVVANVTRQGEPLLRAVAAGGRVVYVIFFGMAGAHLDLHLLARLWPVALGLFGMRAAATVASARLGSRLAKDPAQVARYGWMPLISQAGVTLGMAITVGREYAHSFGGDLSALAVAVVGLNEALGPVLFKLALDRAGETGRMAAAPGVAA